ncbi:MAG: translation initiation factor IF-2 subunit gamma [Candidatus Aenigmatarchaeota archaeon]|nr:MAG: translation initiation factor IF-2 subunit gamma [Candidatus Aenigmarchaeota archaeon]
MAEKEKKIKKSESLPEVNIGLVGHVDHGKTTLTEALSGKWTDTHSEEVKRGITIRIGYADISFYKCPKCGDKTESYGTSPKCMKCFVDCDILRTVSLVDAPGHETLMATVLSGAALMDGAILVISATETCPQPQTSEHLVALDIAGIKNIVVVQNKIDKVDKERAEESFSEIKDFLRGTIAEKAPIVPISAQHRINIDALIDSLEKHIRTPQRDPKANPKMLVARSFDVNRPGTETGKLKGSVLGGSLKQGGLKVGDEIEICPGIRIDDKTKPVKTRITGLQKAMKDQKAVTPGGLLGVSTSLDPSLAKSDSLAGSVIGKPGTLPPVRDELNLKISMLDRVVGIKEKTAVEPLREGVPLMLTIGTSRTVGAITKSGSVSSVKLKLPVCADPGEKVAISRQVTGRWHLVGWGEIV